MNNQTFIIASVILCSLSGWYVVVTKYLALKKMIKDNEMPPHIPGMGPPPVGGVPYTIAQEYLEEHYYEPPHSAPPLPPHLAQQYYAPPVHAPAPAAAPAPLVDEKREICNLACIQHMAGFAIVSGVPFLNAILPTLFWLWKKERHQFIEKNGREVINFQITFSLLQFAFLGLGTLYIRYMPASAEKLFAFTKITRIVFSSGMYIPFNVFTVVPFFWACIVMVRGAVAAYHGHNYKYPAAMQFVTGKNPAPKPVAQPKQAAAKPA